MTVLVLGLHAAPGSAGTLDRCLGFGLLAQAAVLALWGRLAILRPSTS